MEKVYDVYTKFTFNGVFVVKAESKKQAREFVEKDCGMVLGNINSTLPMKDVAWIAKSTPVH